MSVYIHHGPWDEESRKNTVLNFADGTDYTGAPEIWAWMTELFGVFSVIKHSMIKMTVVPQSEDVFEVITESTGTFVLKSDPNQEKIDVPRLVIFTVRKDYSKYYGYIVDEAKIYWDSKVVLQKSQK